MELKYIDLFCGIGGFRIAAEKVFKKYQIAGKCVLSCDIDEHAKKSYFANFNEMPEGDITRLDNSEIPDHDILFAGFPCQPFSIIGQQKGFEDTRGTLFFEIARILDAKRPKMFILENVKQLISHNSGNTFRTILAKLNDLGYYSDYHILNALNYGLPQKRERVIIVGYDKFITFPQPVNNFKNKRLDDILEKDVDDSYYVSSRIREKRISNHQSKYFPSVWHENKAGNISSYPFSCALRAGASYNYLLVNGERRLTSREMLRLQGFPDTFKIVVPDTQVRKQAGNSVVIPQIEAVARAMIRAMGEKPQSRPSQIDLFDKEREIEKIYAH